MLWGGVFNPVVPLGPDAEVGALLAAFDPDHLINLTGEDLTAHLATTFRWRIHNPEQIVRDAQDRRRRRFNIGLGMGAVLRFIHDTELRGATGRSKAAIITNVPEQWQLYAAAVFGTFAHLPGPPVDVASSYKALTMAGDVVFDADADIDYASSLFPIGTTGYGIRRFGGWQSFSSHIVYVGDHQDLGDLAEFWNIRASGREIWFVPAANYRNHRTMIERVVKAGQYDINPRVRNRVVLQKAVGVTAEVFNEARDWVGGLGLTEIMAHVGRPPFRVPGDDDFIGWGISDLEAASGDEQSILSDGRMTPIKLMAPPFLDKDERFAEHEWTIELMISNPYTSEELACQLPKAPGAEDLVRSLIVGGTLGEVRLGHNGSWGEEDPMSVDALALARLPLESLYNMCMFTESPDWVDVYVRDGWKKQYEQFLLQREETKKLKRYDEYSNKKGPHHLAAVGKTIGITKVQVATIEHEQLGTPMPGGLVPDHIPQFPTPGRAINKLPKDGDKRRMLERLYPEYVFLCSFAHGLPDANLFKMMFNKDSKFRDYWSDTELKDTFRRNVAERSYVTSLLGMIQSAAELTALYPGDVELMAGVTKAWEEMSRDSLLGKAIWNIRTKKLLGVIDAPPAAQGSRPNV